MRDPRHILVLVENLSVPFDRRVWHECTTLIEAGYEVSVICPQGRHHDRGPYAEIGGVRIYRYPTPPSASSLAGYVKEYPYMLAWTERLAWRVWREHPFDVIHACNPPDLFFLIGLAFRPLGVSFVFDQHDANPEILMAKRDGVAHDGLPERVVRWAERRTYALADVVIAPNRSYRDLALTRGGRAPDDVFVVRSAPGREEFAQAGDAAFDRRGHRHLVGYVGVMGKQDGVDLLVRAVGDLVDEGRDILLYLAGDGESYADVAALVDELGLGDNVLMPGYQSSAEFTQALRSADVCVAPDPPSPFNDISTMNKIIEYMALGRPTVAFALPENRASGGDTVEYARGDDPSALAAAIRRVLDDDVRRRAMARGGRVRFAEALSWEHSAPQLLRAYERLREKVAPARQPARVRPPRPAPAPAAGEVAVAAVREPGETGERAA
jgi:glycosyltransferase involved in cell wall biosynthesis